ncbi:hypothetical protein ACJJTC_018886, partial [Scirpophaga incertulas]
APLSPAKEVPEEVPANVNIDKENKEFPTSSVSRRDSIPNRTEMLKKNLDKEEISPASRFIAMSRQGLLCSQETKTGQDAKEGAQGDATVNKENQMRSPMVTPVPNRAYIGTREDAFKNLEGASTVRTPNLDDALSTPVLLGLSPNIRNHVQAFKRGEITADQIPTPNNPFENAIETPGSDFGAVMMPGSGKLSPEKRKHLWELVNALPTRQHVEPEETIKTPLSELRKRFLSQFAMDTPPQPAHHHQLAPRKLDLQDQAEKPPAKMAKFSAEQSAGSASIVSAAAESRNASASSASKETSDAKESNSTSASSASSTLPPDVADQLQRLSAALSGRTPQRRRLRPSGAGHTSHG